MRKHYVHTLPIIAAVGWAGQLAAQTSQKAVDWVQMADAVVRSWKLIPGDKVVLVGDPAADRGILPPLRAAINASKAVIHGEITLPTAPTPTPPAALVALFKSADVAIWLPAVNYTSGPVFEHLVEGSRVRTIHFHWFLPPDPADVTPIEAMYARAIMVPPERLAPRLKALEATLRGAAVRVTAPNGTDLTFTVPASAWFHHNTGDASKTKMANARSVRDREEELPASVLRTTDLTRATGKFVGNSSFDLRSPTIAVTFKDGRVVKFESVKGGEAIVKTWQAATGNKDVPGEFVIGTNPELGAVLPSGFMPYYGYGAGVVRLAVGDNWESGGKNRSSNGEVLFFLTGATVTAGGKDIIKDGALVAR